jgi:glutathione S-transferase
MAAPPLRFLSAWFCPFAHRTHVALEHLSLSYEWVEALGWYEEKGEFLHFKTEELKASNPMGTVPTLLEGSSKRPVYESLVCIEYANDVAASAAAAGNAAAFSGSGTANDGSVAARGQVPAAPPLLLSPDPFERAKQRAEAVVVNKQLCSPYYAVLVREDEKERREHFDGLLANLKAFSRRMGDRQESSPPSSSSSSSSSSSPSPYCWGGDDLSIVDLALLPHAYRYFALEHYRGPDFAVPRDDPDFEPFHRWLNHLTEHVPSVRRTLPDKGRYIEHVRKYAENKARSKVAEAVRAGGAAHDMK